MTVMVSTEQVARSVFSSDAVDTSLTVETINHVTEIGLRQLGLVAVIHERLVLELTNGLKLEIKPCK